MIFLSNVWRHVCWHWLKESKAWKIYLIPQKIVLNITFGAHKLLSNSMYLQEFPLYIELKRIWHIFCSSFHTLSVKLLRFHNVKSIKSWHYLRVKLLVICFFDVQKLGLAFVLIRDILGATLGFCLWLFLKDTWWHAVSYFLEYVLLLLGLLNECLDCCCVFLIEELACNCWG